MKLLSQTHLGIILVVISAFVFSTAGLFVKLITAGAWDVIFWRGIYAILFSTLFVVLRGRTKEEFWQMGKIGLIIAGVSAMGTAAFVPAFKLTTIANVSLIYAAAPIIAGLLAWVFVGETMHMRQIIAVIVSFLGMLVIVSGTLGGLHLAGDLMALWMTCAMATVMVLYRAFPNAPATGPVVLSSAILLVPSAIFGSPSDVGASDMMLLILFGLVFAVASVTLMEGAKRISAAQTALLSVLETPLAPILAFLILAEMPATTSLIGGGMIFCAVIWAQMVKHTQ